MGTRPSLRAHQELAVDQLKTGSILCGGVGSGKSMTAVAYYRKNEFPKDVFIITTAAKRDTQDWERECANFSLYPDRSASEGAVKIVVDSWNNIGKYAEEENSFFIFDEQRVVGSGAWVKAFVKIAKHNNWILLSATPGDTWMDYVPVFLANGFYKNRTEFIRRHVVYNQFTKYPKVDRYVETARLQMLKTAITVNMDYKKETEKKLETIISPHDVDQLELALKGRWNPFTNKPIKDISELCYTMRRIVNTDSSRLLHIRKLLLQHPRLIIFYNFNYELDILRELSADSELTVAEHNGKKHDPVPETARWAYLVQYQSGAEGWNCITTNAIAFYSLNYSYRIMTQAAGRIDRMNTPFATLYLYYIRSSSAIDNAIYKSLKNKENFNDSKFLKGE